MADISKITLPSGTTYDIKDAVAREAIAGGVKFLGVTTTELTDGSATNPITVGGESVTAINGSMAIYQSKEFVFATADNKWHEFGDTSGLGDLAYKDSASATYTPVGAIVINASSGSGTSYTPEGSVGAPTISVSSVGSTSTIHNPTKVTVAKTVATSAPGATAPDNAITYYSVSNETLSLYQIGYTTGDSITTTDVTVKTGDASYTASAPTFTGTEKKLAFTGTEATITVS